MTNSDFDQQFHKILEPKLHSLGFTRLVLKDCMCPEYLYEKGRLWFELSWDWRDRYLEVSLGNLFWFKDVMPRVVVVGDYASYDNRIDYDAMDKFHDESEVFELISSSLDKAISVYESSYDKILINFIRNRKESRGINVEDYIGNEVSRDELSKFED